MLTLPKFNFVTDERKPTKNAEDIWHTTKGIAKGIKKITQGPKKDMGKKWHPQLSDKAASIKTHVYWYIWCIKNCEANEQKLKAGIDNIIDHYNWNHSRCNKDSACQQVHYEPSKKQITAQT
jgi:hypothetical protein